jgi:PAS domain S-box-containing protein
LKLESSGQNEDFLLRTISDGTASETGTLFFKALVKNLSEAMGTHGAWITEYLPELKRLRALAFWLGGKYVEQYEYDIQGTPCEKLLANKKYLHIPQNVVDLFPGDPDLPKIGAVSYIGFPLLNKRQEILGNIAVVDTRPIPDSFRNLAVFRIFAARATAEILRLKAESELQGREEKLRGVFEGAMDAIVELDKNLRTAMMNPSAIKLFGVTPDTTLGASIESFLIPRDFQRLTDFVGKWNHPKQIDRKIWIPGGLTIVDLTGEKICTEATLSQLEMHGLSYYVLILRNVKERYEAAKLIASLQHETYYLRDEIRSLYNQGDIIGKSNALQQTLMLVAEVAPTDSTVLLYGETGTGKELIARAIHLSSKRRDRSMITVNCASIPHTLMESEFFGHEKGAFTGATQNREGRFSLADRGTIFLDEIGELNLEMQAKLLRVLQEGEFAPVGSSRNRHVDVRVIAATNRNLSQAIQQGTFRTDLYYRLSVFPITIPPLREREGDINLLARHFINKYASCIGKHIKPISSKIADSLNGYSWPGNVRELQNVIERGVITARDGYLNLEYALPGKNSLSGNGEKEQELVSEDRVLTILEMRHIERKNLLRALQQSEWRVAGKQGAARLLGIPPSTLQSRMKALGIERPGTNGGTYFPSEVVPGHHQ